MDASQYDTPSGANCFVRLYPTILEEVTSFVATKYELLELVKIWQKEILEMDLWFFLYRCGGCCEISPMIVAEIRIKAIRAAIGDEDVDKAISEAEEDFAQKQNPRHWQIFKHGNDAEREALWNEIDNPTPPSLEPTSPEIVQ